MLNMENKQELSKQSEYFICRYCLDNNNQKNLINPCNCNGTSKYVHKECLLEWLIKQANGDIEEGYFIDNIHSCEICKYQYKFIETIKTKYNCPNILRIIYNFITIQIILSLSYLTIGVITSYSYNYFTTKFSGWNEIFINGIIHTHFILGIYYIFIPILPKLKRPKWIKYIFGKDRSICSYILLLILGIIIHPYYNIYRRLNNKIMILEILEKI